MARLTMTGIDGRTAYAVSRFSRGIWRGNRTLQSIDLRPVLPNSSGDRVDLFIGEHAAGTLRKRGHRSSLNSVGGNSVQSCVIYNRQVHRITQSDCRSALSVSPVATRAVCAVEGAEIGNRVRSYRRFLRSQAPRRVATAAHTEAREKHEAENGEM